MYDVLRADILDLKLRPGLVFSIKDVCDAYEVGRTPVREALIRLSKEGPVSYTHLDVYKRQGQERGRGRGGRGRGRHMHGRSGDEMQ